MSFRNEVNADGSINISVIPTFGHIVNMPESEKAITIHEVERWKAVKGSLHSMPHGFDPSRYACFSVKEQIEEAVPAEVIHDYVEKSRLSHRLGF